ncbi:cytochrome P450 family protein [Thermoflavimicrobium dichotomicum]|uniref:Cytochrome P450 n=1 Tax=Thermoflavimicrobium dichotomicum TaxID=46223 RepID=A0A1I3T5L9_9BACL|nr:cytochrome P450 [Thermoflavimicrobium dichotomicum]SFJ64827.1 hypothetical protein SAMN05421852_11534 [Thermoflavimicrobium dichotomicum]
MQPVNPFSPDFKEHAYEIYQELREKDPVHQITMPNGNIAWIISRYHDAVSLLKDKRLQKNPRTVFSAEQYQQAFPFPEMRLFIEHMLNSDPPDHTRLRSLVQKAFTPRIIENLRPRIQEIADQLLESVEAQGHMDIIQDYAFPLPIILISELLGIPTEDRNQFRQWSNAVIYAFNQPERLKQVLPEIRAFHAYLQTFITKRRQNPQDDLTSELIRAETENEKLSEKELYSMLFLLIIAGHETTVNLIGNSVFSLLQHPDQCEKLKKEPAFISLAVEEFLRYMSPVEFATNRWAIEDIQLHGKTIKKQDLVLISIASANRDPAKFTHPEKLDITREKNEHIAFGHGIHFCLGAPLARLEGQIAIQTLLQRIPAFELAVTRQELKWQSTFLMRGLQHLPIRF